MCTDPLQLRKVLLRGCIFLSHPRSRYTTKWSDGQRLAHVPVDLSASERKFVTIASILSMNADVLIFDEPTMGQDALGIGRLHPIMDRLSETGRTVIVISHDMEFVAEHFDRMLVLSEGSLISDGSVRDIFLNRADVLTESGLRRPATLRICQRLGISPPPLRFAEAVTSLRSLIS